MTIRDALNQATQRLHTAGFDDARLEAEVLLQAALGWSKTELLARLTEPVPEQAQRQFAAYLARRLAHEPSAYITGHREFYGLDLCVTPAVLIPRPETELAVDVSLALARQRHPRGESVLLADIGTGSGAIALALATHLPGACIYAVDISDAALNVARCNARRLGLARRIEFLQGDLAQPLPVPVDIIVANLPYISDEEDALPPEIWEYEPCIALRGGPGGLELIERLLAGIRRRLRPHGNVVLEIDHRQGSAVGTLVERYLPGATSVLQRDLAGLDRVVVVTI